MLKSTENIEKSGRAACSFNYPLSLRFFIFVIYVIRTGKWLQLSDFADSRENILIRRSKR